MIIRKFNSFSISKFLICLLCCIMLFSLISRPITAHASATATVAIGAYGVIKVVLSAKVLVGLIIGSFSGFVMSALVPDMDDWYDSDPVVRNWADRYNGSISGGEVITIPSDVQNSIRSRYDVSSSINISTLYVPYDLTHLEKVSAAHIFGTDVAAQLEANNALVQQSNRLLLYIGEAINEMFLSLSAELTKVKNNLTRINSNVLEEFRQVKNLLVNINSNVEEELRQVKNLLNGINSNMEEELRQVKNGLASIRNDIVDELRNVFSKLSTINESFKSSINNLTSVLESGILRIEAKIDSIVNSITHTATPPPPSGGSGNAGNTVSSGVNKGMAWFGNSNGIFAEYATAFLVATMIFNLFADITFFNKLLIVSASIGLVGVFLGLVLNGAQADSSARKEAEREAKREAYRESRHKRKGG